MSAWLRSPEKMPSRFSCEGEAERPPPRRKARPSPLLRMARTAVRTVSTRTERLKHSSVAAW